MSRHIYAVRLSLLTYVLLPALNLLLRPACGARCSVPITVASFYAIGLQGTWVIFFLVYYATLALGVGEALARLPVVVGAELLANYSIKRHCIKVIQPL